MPTVRMPKLGDDIEEASVVRWLKSDGDVVTRGEAIAEIETEKANVELEADADGPFRGLVDAGLPVPVGSAIATIGESDDEEPSLDDPEVAPPVGASATDAVGPWVSSHDRGDEEPRSPDQGRVRASPSARKLAGQHGLEISTISGSGPRGRVIRADVERAAQARADGARSESAADEGLVADPSRPSTSGWSHDQKSIGASSIGMVPEQTNITVDVRMGAAMGMVVDGDGAAALTITDLLLKAVSMALVEHPAVNASLDDRGPVRHDRVDLRLEIPTDEGVLSVDLVDCAYLSVPDLAARARQLTDRARLGTLEPTDRSSTAVVISNVGALGVDSIVAALGPTRAPVVTAGVVADRPVVGDGAISIAPTMRLTCSTDERVVARTHAARFVSAIRDVLERPGSMLA